MDGNGVLFDKPGDRRIAVADRSQRAAAASGRRVEIEQDELALSLGLLRGFLQRLLPAKRGFGKRLSYSHDGSSF
jgi:hypothetical protein